MSVEAYAAGAEERTFVGSAIVEGADVVLIDYIQSLVDVERDAKVSSQSVARATRNDAEGGVRVAQGSRHLINSAVATHSNHAVEIVVDSFLSEGSGV